MYEKNGVLVIAEVGVNHNGDLMMAKRMIEAAAEAEADVVKFQTYNADRLVTLNAEKADYQKQTTVMAETQHAMLKRLELSRDMYEELVEHCKHCHIGFLSTGFDIENVNFLASLGLSLFKIPSGEITNLPYLRHIGNIADTVILSSGMATLGEIEAALIVLEESGTTRADITVMHCTTEYPAPIDEVNLRAMQTIHQAFGVPIGYSDHTDGIEVAVAAVALGATVIEKHFTLDRALPGPDQKASIEPHELKSMVRAVRNIELALGDGIKRQTQSEARNRLIVRKSIVAKRYIKTGERFNEENLSVKRPGYGVSPMLWDFMIGRLADRDYSVDEFIKL